MWKKKKVINQELQALIEEHDKIDDEISLTSKSCANSILSSLKSDFKSYKSDDQYLVNLLNPNHCRWVVTELSADKMELTKSSLLTDENKKTFDSKMRLKCKYDNIGQFDLTSIEVIVGGSTSIKLNNEDFKDIISLYFYAYKIHLKNSTLLENKDSLAKLSKIIGNDIKRDDKLNKLLND